MIALIPILGLYRWWIEAALQVRAARDQFTLAGRGVPHWEARHGQ